MQQCCVPSSNSNNENMPVSFIVRAKHEAHSGNTIEHVVASVAPFRVDASDSLQVALSTNRSLVPFQEILLSLEHVPHLSVWTFISLSIILRTLVSCIRVNLVQ